VTPKPFGSSVLKIASDAATRQSEIVKQYPDYGSFAAIGFACLTSVSF
jgi:hypothetical protein